MGILVPLVDPFPIPLYSTWVQTSMQEKKWHRKKDITPEVHVTSSNYTHFLMAVAYLHHLR